jgi:hypothetical protein
MFTELERETFDPTRQSLVSG